MKRGVLAVLALGAAAAAVAFVVARRTPKSAAPRIAAAAPTPTRAATVQAGRLEAVGPTEVSNQTAYPLALYGQGFRPGDQVVLSGVFARTLPGVFVNAQHLAARLPPQVLNAHAMSVDETVRVIHRDGARMPGAATLTVVNDASYPEPYACALTPDGHALFVASPTTDEVYRYDTASGARETIHTGDGPRALAVTADGSQVVIADAFAGALELRAVARPGAPRVLSLNGERPQDLALDGDNAWVTTRRGGLLEVNLKSGEVVRHALPGRQPRSIALGPHEVWVAQLGTEDVVTWPGLHRIAPGPGVRIVGGPSVPFSKWVMGGKAPRDLAYDPGTGLLFASTLGPNVGPNPEKTEVAPNSGIEVIDARTSRVLLHLGLGAGVLEGLAVDPARHRLYAADIALGRIVAFDTQKLRDDPEHAQVAELALAPPAGAPHLRPDADFGVNGRAGLSIHTGPRALCLDAARQRLYSVNRLAGTVSVVDVSRPHALALATTFAGPTMWTQRTRWLGEVAYFSDLGRTGYTCDGCHLEGQASGVFYAKAQPRRVWRAPTLRGIRDSAPYFTPAAFHDLESAAQNVLRRLRIDNPAPSADELAWVSAYEALFTVPPNPYVGADGAPRHDVALPDGPHGDAVKGMSLFESKRLGCSSRLCHPRPTFSADQSPLTRNHFANVGTPITLPIGLPWQDTYFTGWPPPPLAGIWDVYPLLQSGAAGLGVKDGAVVPTTPFALRAVLQAKGEGAHGRMDALTPQQANDLLAYLLSI